MNIIQRAALRLAGVKLKDLAALHPEAFTREILYSGNSDQARDTMPAASNAYDEYAGQAWIYKATSTVARSFRSVPLYVMRGEDWIEGHPVERLLAKPNPAMTGSAMWERWITDVYLAGETGLEVTRNKRGEVAELWPRQGRTVTIDAASSRYLKANGYTIKDGAGDPYTLTPDEFIWSWLYNPLSVWRGLGVYQAAALGILTDKQAQKYAASFFRGMARPDFVLTAPQGITETEKQMMLAQIEAQTQGKNRGLVLEKDVLSITPLAFAPKDVIWETIRAMTREEIGAVAGVPGELMGDKSATYENRAEAVKSFWNDTLKPLCNWRDEHLTEYFRAIGLIRAEETVESDFSGVEALEQSYADRLTYATQLTALGVTLRDANDMLDLGIPDASLAASEVPEPDPVAAPQGQPPPNASPPEGQDAAKRYKYEGQPRDEAGRFGEGGGGAGVFRDAFQPGGFAYGSGSDMPIRERAEIARRALESFDSELAGGKSEAEVVAAGGMSGGVADTPYAANLLAREAEIVYGRGESGTIVLKDGSKAQDLKGSKSTVVIPYKNDLGGDKIPPGIHFTHNHPNGFGFSIPDVQTFGQIGSQSIRAVTINDGKIVRYEITRPESGYKPGVAKTLKALRDEWPKIQNSIIAGAADAGAYRSDSEDARAIYEAYNHASTARACAEHGLRYSRVVVGPATGKAKYMDQAKSGSEDGYVIDDSELLDWFQKPTPQKSLTRAMPWPVYGSDEHKAMLDVWEKALAPREARMRQALKQLFAEQEKDVLRRLNAEKQNSKIQFDPALWTHSPELEREQSMRAYKAHLKSVSDAPFDLAKWIRLFKLRLSPQIRLTLAEAGRDAMNDLNIGVSFDVSEPQVLNYMRDRENKIKGVVEKTFDDLKRDISAGIEQGESIDKIAARVQERMGPIADGRATMIARTEVIGASNGGKVLAWKQSGVVTGKRWLASTSHMGANDPHPVRDTHVDAHGQEVGIDEDFSVGNGEGKAPGQITNGGDSLPEENINCRCTMLAVTDQGRGMKAQTAPEPVVAETRQPINVTVSVAAPVVNVSNQLPAPVVNVAAAEVTIPEQPAPVVNVSIPEAKEQPAPVVNVSTPMATSQTQTVNRDEQGNIISTTTRINYEGQ